VRGCDYDQLARQLVKIKIIRTGSRVALYLSDNWLLKPNDTRSQHRSEAASRSIQVTEG